MTRRRSLLQPHRQKVLDCPMGSDVPSVILPEKDSPTVDVFRDAFAAPASVAV